MKMLPFAEPTIFETLPRLFFRMPRVVLNQKAKFETDELFKKLSRDSEVRFIGYKDKNEEAKKLRFFEALRSGYLDIAFYSTGTNFQLFWEPMMNVNNSNGFNNLDPFGNGCDFTREPGKVHIKCRFIMNGVCVRWRGWFDLTKFDGVGRLEFDEEAAKIEDSILRQQIKCAHF